MAEAPLSGRICLRCTEQPTHGFYAPAQLIADARRHAVNVLPVDVRYSDWDYTLEEKDGEQAIRVGMRSIKGLAQACAKRIVQARAEAAFTSMADLRRRGRCDRKALQALAGADALQGISGNRHQAGWQVAAAVNEPLQQDLVAAPAERECRSPSTFGARYPVAGLRRNRVQSTQPPSEPGAPQNPSPNPLWPKIWAVCPMAPWLPCWACNASPTSTNRQRRGVSGSGRRNRCHQRGLLAQTARTISQRDSARFLVTDSRRTTD